jgi:hypothetical protein
LDQRLCKVHVPELAKDILEQIAFEARDSIWKSGQYRWAKRVT